MSRPPKRHNQLDQFNFHHTLTATPGLAVVFFTRPGCSACHFWKQLLAEWSVQRLDVRIFEVDAEQDSALIQEFDVFHLPALYLYRDGGYVGAIHCEADKTALDTTIAHLLSLPPQEAP